MNVIRTAERLLIFAPTNWAISRPITIKLADWLKMSRVNFSQSQAIGERFAKMPSCTATSG